MEKREREERVSGEAISPSIYILAPKATHAREWRLHLAFRRRAVVVIRRRGRRRSKKVIHPPISVASVVFGGARKLNHAHVTSAGAPAPEHCDWPSRIDFQEGCFN